MERARRFLKDNGLVLAIIGVLVIGYLLLRTPGDRLASTDEFERQIRSGQPTLVVFYTNTCTSCLLARPAIDGLARGLQGKANVLRLDALSESGSSIATRYEVRGVPTLILFDGEGNPVLRQVGTVRAQEVKTAVDALLE